MMKTTPVFLLVPLALASFAFSVTGVLNSSPRRKGGSKLNGLTPSEAHTFGLRWWANSLNRRRATTRRIVLRWSWTVALIIGRTAPSSGVGVWWSATL